MVVFVVLCALSNTNKDENYKVKKAAKQDCTTKEHNQLYKPTRMWVNAQRDGRPAEHRWRLLFNAAKFG